MRRRAVLDCVVVGAAPAGLAASTALTAAGIQHLLELGQPGSGSPTPSPVTATEAIEEPP